MDRLEPMTFTFDDLTVSAHSTSPGHVVWLREFLEPDFAVTNRAPVDCEVLIEEDARLYADLLGAGPAADARMLDCFALDSSVVRLPIVNRAGAVTTVFDAQFEAVYEIDPERRRVRIVTGPGNRRVRASLLRVVREFAMNHLHGRSLLLHASAIAVGDAGIAIAGHKAAGKTTLLTYLLMARVGRYLSNDRIAIIDEDGPPLLRNIPTVISVRPGTLELCPDFGDAFKGSRFSTYLVTIAEAAREPDSKIVPNQFGNYFLSPAQFRSLVHARQRQRAAARVLLFPVISNDVGTFELRELSRSEAALRLPEVFLGAGGWRKGTDAFAIPSGRPMPDPLDLVARAERFVAHVRSFECRLGPLAYRDRSLADHIPALAGGPR